MGTMAALELPVELADVSVVTVLQFNSMLLRTLESTYWPQVRGDLLPGAWRPLKSAHPLQSAPTSSPGCLASNRSSHTTTWPGSARSAGRKEALCQKSCKIPSVHTGRSTENRYGTESGGC